MTPEDVRQLKFRRTLRGYDTAEVERLLAEVAASLDELARDREELRSRVERLERELGERREIDHLMREALVSAQRAADELKERTRRECEEALAKARSDAGEIETSSRRERERAEDELRRLKLQERELRASYRVLLHAALDRLERAGEEDEELKPTLLEALAPRRVSEPAEGSGGEEPVQPPPQPA